MNAPIIGPMLRIVFAYAFFAALWILLSDQLLVWLAPDAAAFARLSTYKGWAFVAVTSLLLTALLRNELEARRRAHAEVETEVGRRTAELRAALHAAESADRLKSAFLATMSHELRTPMNSIIGFTGILLQELPGRLNDEQKQQLGMVQNSAHHLLALITAILDLSRLETGELHLDLAPFDIAAAIEQAVAQLRPQAQAKGLTLTLAMPRRPTAESVRGDVRRFEQILLELLDNAIKFTAQGSVTLTIAIPNEYSESSDDAVRLEVSDTGIGIRPEDLDTLFQPFHQIDASLARQHEGTGLGLAVSQRLARLMGGRIEVSSRLGEGSRFTLCLPRPSPPPKPESHA